MPGLVPGIHVLARNKTWMAGTSARSNASSPRPAMTQNGFAYSLQLRLVARLDRGLGFRFAQFCLVVDHLADARECRAFDPRFARPQTRAHQRLAAMKVGLLHGDAQYRARKLAEFFERGQSIRLGRQRACAANAQRLVNPRHEKNELHEAGALDDVSETVDPVIARAIGHQEPVRTGHLYESGVAAARRGIDAAV